jgi:phosphatidylserine/phosphatidylglycerophosphate/cardiolipin synthase-like enzyme
MLITGMPWHDIQMYVSGAAAMDAAFNFVQRWNHHCKTTTKYAGKPKYAPLSCEGYADYDKPPSDDAPKITKSKGSKSSKSKDLLEEPAEEFDKEDEEEEPTDIDSAKTSDEKV